MKVINTDEWARRAPYENFIKYTDPIFSLAVRMDVTALCARHAEKGTSFFADMLYMVSRAVNETEEFRLRLRDGNVVLYDVVQPSYIVMTDDGVIVTCRTDYCEDYNEFYARVRADVARMKKSGTRNGSFNHRDDTESFYVSCLPWADIISVSDPYDLADRDNCSIPRITWGKFTDEGGRKKLTMNVSAHHALIDGEPVCRAFNAIQREIDRCGTLG